MFRATGQVKALSIFLSPVACGTLIAIRSGSQDWRTADTLLHNDGALRGFLPPTRIAMYTAPQRG